MKKFLTVLFAAIMTVALITGCGNSQTETTVTETTVAETTAAATTAEPANLANEVTIVYTNDIHAYVLNTVEDADGNKTPGLRLSNVAALVKDKETAGENVLLVDAGDIIQGSIYGSYDEGESVINMYNTAGYDIACPGNHDFDYGMFAAMKIIDKADFPFVSCNFMSEETQETALPKYEILEAGGVKIAFIGITTPTTITTSTPAYFQDENGNYIYSFVGTGNAEDLYSCVQETIDEVKDQADIVIALGHCGIGIDEQAKGLTSKDIIANTTGLDAFIDGHSHNVIQGDEVKDKDGNTVLLTQTGAYLANIGVMTISADKTIKTEFVTSYEKSDESVKALEDKLETTVTESLSQKICTLQTTLYINNPENAEQRIVRAKETNAGDFVSDSIYWYFNESLGQNCDVVLTNGGAVRAQLEAGDITYLDAKNISPFGNQVCMVEVTGQDILDALEMGATVIGQWDDQWNAPAENGGFMHVAGLTYTIDTSVASSVKTDKDGMFASVDGDYRVKDVKVYNKESKTYEDLDVNKSYTVGGINYILRNSGNGLSMFADSKLVVDYVGQDVDLLVNYMKSFAEQDGYPYICTANSPLSGYEGYLINYEEPYGAGRIVEK